MAFRANPSDGEYHNENWRDFYGEHSRYYSMYSPVVTHVKEALVRNQANVTVNRHVPNRYARRMIKLHCAFKSNSNSQALGLGISTASGWLNFAPGSNTFNSASGVTNYGNGGSEYTNWEKGHPFAYSFWLHDLFDNARGVGRNFPGMVDVTLVKHEDHGTMMTWQCQHRCQGTVPLWTCGKAVITTPIENMVALDLRCVKGSLTVGCMTLECY